MIGVSTDDRLKPDRSSTGIAAGPRATIAYERWPELVPALAATASSSCWSAP